MHKKNTWVRPNKKKTWLASPLAWIPEPSTVNNKLKRREGSGSTGGDSLIKPRQSQNRISGFSTDSVLKPLILFCDWRGLIKESPVEPEPSRRFNLLFTVEGSGIQGTSPPASRFLPPLNFIFFNVNLFVLLLKTV